MVLHIMASCNVMVLHIMRSAVHVAMSQGIVLGERRVTRKKNGIESSKECPEFSSGLASQNV